MDLYQRSRQPAMRRRNGFNFNPTRAHMIRNTGQAVPSMAIGAGELDELKTLRLKQHKRKKIKKRKFKRKDQAPPVVLPPLPLPLQEEEKKDTRKEEAPEAPVVPPPLETEEEKDKRLTKKERVRLLVRMGHEKWVAKMAVTQTGNVSTALANQRSEEIKNEVYKRRGEERQNEKGSFLDPKQRVAKRKRPQTMTLADLERENKRRKVMEEEMKIAQNTVGNIVTPLVSNVISDNCVVL